MLNKKAIIKIIPKPLLNLYHYCLAFFFAARYNFPSRKIVTIGITGTKGKTSVSYLIYYLLTKLNFKVALSSSDFLYIGEELLEKNNRLTMPGRGFLHWFLKKAVDNNCDIAIIEVTSEGLIQHRHAFIDFDIAVFLGLHPEHIEQHGSYEAYRNAKGKLFYALEKSFRKLRRDSKRRKKLKGIDVKKTIIVNLDDFEADYFLSFKAEQKITFSLETQQSFSKFHLMPTKYKINQKGIEFILEDKKFVASHLFGKSSIYNVLASFSVLKALDLPLAGLDGYLKDFHNIPGRFDIIQSKSFKVIIDYAHTPHSIEELYSTILKLFKPKRLLCLIGSAGGLRDKWKRPVIGEIAARYCHYIVISNEDPYDEDPLTIMEAIELGAKRYLAEFGVEKPIEIIPDRKEAIYKLVQTATKGDVIVTIGKGAEPSITFNDQEIPWNEKEVVLEAIKSKTKPKAYSKISTKTS